MTTSYATETDRVIAEPGVDRAGGWRGRLSWRAVLAGVALVISLEIAFNLLGLGVGMSLLDPLHPNQTPSAGAFSIAGALWFVVINWTAVLAGAYLAGRLCGFYARIDGAFHGVVVWAASLLLVAYMVSAAVGSTVGAATKAAGNAAGPATAQMSPMSSGPSGASSLLAPSDPAQMSPEAAERSVSADLARLAVNPKDPSVDPQRLTHMIATRAGISDEEAQQRLATWRQNAQQAADAARKAAAYSAIGGFIALAIGLIAAYFGGRWGAHDAYEASLRTEMNT